jgi:S1-C subfamily serine protease
MFTEKRTLILITVLALAVSGLGVLSVSASNTNTAASTLAQDSGGAWLGVQIKDAKDGVTVEEVLAGSPAETAGLKVGDVIQSVDGEAVDSADQFVTAIQSHLVGDEVTLLVLTGSEAHDVKVTLGERPADLDQQQPSTGNRPHVEGVLDFLGLNAESTDQGLQVKSIAADSPFADSGLQEGDIITAINGEAIDANSFPGGWMRLLRADTNPITFTVLRDGASQDIEVTIDWSKLGVQGGTGSMTMQQPQPTQLGVRFRTLTAEIAQQDSLPVNEGAQVLEVYADSPAEKAGLQKDDIITAVDGDKVDEEHTLADRLYAYEEGDAVTLSVQRGADTVEIQVTLGPKMDNGWFGMMPGMDGSMMPFGNGRNGQGFQFQMPGNGNGWFDFHMEPGQQDQNPDQAPATEAAPSNPA